jgi:hypothetical protein
MVALNLTNETRNQIDAELERQRGALSTPIWNRSLLMAQMTSRRNVRLTIVRAGKRQQPQKC